MSTPCTDHLSQKSTLKIAFPCRPTIPRPIHAVGPVPISPHNGGAFGELSNETEKKESERLDAARNKVVEELESWRAKLIQYESEIKSLRKDIEGP